MTDLLLPLSKSVTYITVLLAAGLPIYLCSAGRKVALDWPVRLTIASLALLGIPVTLLWVGLSVAAMMGQPPTDLDLETVKLVADATPLTMVTQLRGASLLLLGGLALFFPKRFLLMLAGFPAIASFTLSGHAGAGEEWQGALLQLSDFLHLVAVSCWFGALFVLLRSALSHAERSVLVDRLSGFALTGTAIVAVVVVTGLANILLITGWPPNCRATWTLLLAIKLILFACMLGFAGANRWRLTPAVERGDTGAKRRLQMSIGLETAAAIAILMLVSWLGSLSPAE